MLNVKKLRAKNGEMIFKDLLIIILRDIQRSAANSMMKTKRVQRQKPPDIGLSSSFELYCLLEFF